MGGQNMGRNAAHAPGPGALGDIARALRKTSWSGPQRLQRRSLATPLSTTKATLLTVTQSERRARSTSQVAHPARLTSHRWGHKATRLPQVPPK